ncbi:MULTISPECIES: tetratricopeptide repeat protein [Roseobacteraceae]|jgi:tetratricopeptide (TPR) repeat protein|uniref:Tetratricopeptide repeat protein n=1 Tax=Pseudosulfitobacter pseudonitzschiae TaxID=1402135 RepID=A0A221K1V1_9RHOB|nr:MULTISPECIES: tetratricopeptide repeat protein [Roseobacteraceae]ASM72883.1 tetratricopeptide repeat protein [Pseudosulfitobacter pseudonitzschiae]
MDHSDELARLFDDARAAPTEAAARGVAEGLWNVYLRAPDADAQAILDRGMARREGYDFLGAKTEFDRLIAYCPAYAEGWNQRAFVYFLQGDFVRALADLDEALARTPNHVAAQSGRALTLMQLGQREDARAQLLEALENNPWLSERALIAPGAPLGPQVSDAPGEDI